MPLFTVTWTIDIDADTHEDAAREALTIQRDPDSLATTFMVACAEPGRRYTTKPVQITTDVRDTMPAVVRDAMEAALRNLVDRCDGEEGVRADGSNIDTCEANHLLARLDAARDPEMA